MPVCREIAVSSAAECSIPALEAFYSYLDLIEPVMCCQKEGRLFSLPINVVVSVVDSGVSTASNPHTTSAPPSPSPLQQHAQTN